jgi:CubicO group peptidase (beta-lactamase class C family)
MGVDGVQVAAYAGGHLVADAYAGHTGRGGELVGPTTLFPVHSVTKAFAATSLHIQADRGLVDYDAPVAKYWPEFAANGKGSITVRHVLSHRAGVPVPPDLTYDQTANWEWMIESLAGSTPVFPPGEKSLYQALAFGFLVGEVVRRTDPQGRHPEAFIRDEIFGPLDIENDAWLVVPEDHRPRVARLNSEALGSRRPGQFTHFSHPESWSVTYRQAKRPYVPYTSGSGVMTARAVARLFAMLANLGELDGVRLLSEDRVRSFVRHRPVSREYDEVLGFIPTVGEYGYWVGSNDSASVPVVGGPNVLCHPGVGGAIGWADLDLGLGAAICLNRLIPSHPPPSPADHPFTAIGAALREIASESKASVLP